ncbi:MAG: ftsI [Acidimicrobiales bacterium]|nr:ftsI [Acidimicrobiales bacterium]
MTERRTPSGTTKGTTGATTSGPARGSRKHGRGTPAQRERVAEFRAQDRRLAEAEATRRGTKRPSTSSATGSAPARRTDPRQPAAPTAKRTTAPTRSSAASTRHRPAEPVGRHAGRSAGADKVRNVGRDAGRDRHPVEPVSERLKADASRRRQPRHAKPLARVQHTSRRDRVAKRLTPGWFRAGSPRKRLIALLVGAALVFGAILVRITMLQTTDAASYTLAGTHQRTEETVLPASRGVIFDRNGDELALSVPATTIFVNPKLVLDPVGTAAVLATTLHLSPAKQQSLVVAMSDKTKGFEYVARQIDDATALAVMSLKLAGVDSYEEDTRVVPGGDLALGVIGKTDTDGKGIAGLERQYDTLLTGKNGELVQEHDTKGNAIPGSGSVSVPAVPGTDLVLTLDRSIQFSLEQALLKQVSELRAKGGTAIVEESGTGNILAMASVQIRADGTYAVTSANLGAVACEEPGSVAKVITTSAALNEGLITPQTYIEVPGYRIYDKGTRWEKVIHDAEPHKTEMMSVQDILVHSSNIGTIAESEALGPERQYNYMTAFGLGLKSALDFPSETKGLLAPWQKWQGTEKVTKSYGYGVCATAIQLVGAVNVVANNGVYVAPRLVQGTIGEDGVVAPAAPAATRTVLTPDTAQTMNLMMRAVVCDGTGAAAQVDGITVAGKTGTGVKAVNGVYGAEGKDAKYYSSFIGFFPAEAPKVTTLISIDEPDPTNLNRFGGTAAAPVFQAVVPTIMHQLEIQPPNTTGGCPKS